MELNEMKLMWQNYNAKLEKTLKVNLHFIEWIQALKLKSKLNPLLWRKNVEATLHSLAIILLIGFLGNNLHQFPYAASAVLLIAFYVVALVSCVKQIMIIRRMDYSNDIVTIQSSLLMLQTNIVNYARLTILCIPCFLAYPVVVSKAIKDFHITAFAEFDMIALSHGAWWTAQLSASLVLIPLSIWTYTQLTYKNVDKEWVKKFIDRSSGTRIRKALESIKELQSLRHDIV